MMMIAARAGRPSGVDADGLHGSPRRAAARAFRGSPIRGCRFDPTCRTKCSSGGRESADFAGDESEMAATATYDLRRR